MMPPVSSAWRRVGWFGLVLGLAAAGARAQEEAAADSPLTALTAPGESALSGVTSDERARILQQWTETGKRLLDDGAFREAQRLFERVLAYRENDQEALESLEKAKQAEPETWQPHQQPDLAPADLETELAAADAEQPAAPQRVEASAMAFRPEEEKLFEAYGDILDEDYATAIPKLEWVIDNDPTLLGAWEALGWSYWMTGRRQDTMNLWKRLETLVPGSPMAHNLLAKVYIGQGMMEEASHHLEKSLALDPTQYETRYAYARVTLWRGRAEAAIPMLEALLKEDPDRMDVRLQLARALDADRRYERSSELWAQAREMAPENPDFILGEGRALLRMGDLEGAQVRARTLLDMKVHESEAWMILADAAEFGLKPEDAVPILDDIVEQTDDLKLQLNLVNRLTVLQLRLHRSDPVKYPIARAIRSADEALNRDTNNVNFHLLKGELLLLQGSYMSAEMQFKKVLKDFNPNNRRAHYGLFQAFLSQRLIEDAEDALKKMEAFDPQDPYHHYHRAMLALAQGDFQETYKFLDRLEREGARGSVLMLLYHGLTPSEYMGALPVRIFREQMVTLKKAGYRFIKPDDLIEYFEKHPEPPKHRPRSLWRRFVTRLREAWYDTWAEEEDEAERKHTPALEDFAPEKVVCVTFDDALRSSFRWATQVAEELDLCFGMHIPVGNILSYDPNICSWEELRAYQDTGRWDMGSHLVDAGLLAPINSEGYEGRPLPNRLWVPEKNRPETLLEYNLRIQREFKLSWEMLNRELRLEDRQPLFMAYPMGDLGQEDRSDVPNAISSILMEADLHYQLGFRQSLFGHAVKGDHNLLYQRHEMERWQDGQTLLRYAGEHHPVFLARRVRAEIAALEGRPHKAMRMIELLKRDGLPDSLLDETLKYVQTHLARKTEMPEQTTRVETEKSPWRLQFKEPFLAVGAEILKDNAETESWELYLRGGLNVTPRVTMELRGSVGNYKHVIKTFETVETSRIRELTNETDTTTVTTNGTEVVQERVTTRTEIIEYTNIVTRTEFAADITTLGLRSTYKSPKGTIVSGHVTLKTYASDSPGNQIDGETMIAAALDFSGKPTLFTDGALRFSYDAIPTAVDLITYFGIGLVGSWDIRDPWQFVARMSFNSLSDDNSLLFLNLQNWWRLSELQGIYIGLEGEYANAGEKKDEYWTPHWLQRALVLLEKRRHYFQTYFKLGVRYGWGREKGWPDEVARYQQSKAQAEQFGYYPGEDPDKDWDSIIGLYMSVNKKFWRNWEATLRGSVNELPDYSSHALQLELMYRF